MYRVSKVSLVQIIAKSPLEVLRDASQHGKKRMLRRKTGEKYCK